MLLFQNASPAFSNNARPAPKCETHVLSISERDAHVSNYKCDGRVSAPRKVRISIKQRDTRVQHGMSSRHKMPKSPHPQGFETSSSDVLSTDLRDYLTRKRSVHQITHQYHCERLISAVFSDCHCSFQITKPLVFNQLSTASNLAKR